MKPMLPPLNALRAFEAAGRLGSFKEAAAELHVTQGAVSQQVHALEAWLGAPLFERQHRSVVLTAAARAYLDDIGPLFAHLGQSTARYGLPRAAPRALSINASATFALRWLVPRLAAFRALHPDVEMTMDTSNEPVESLREGYDLIVRGGPDTFYGYVMRPFLNEERVPICSPALKRRGRLREPVDLERHTLLHTTSLPRLWPDWLTKANLPALRPASSMTLDHFYLTIQAAIDGVGVAVGPTALVASDLEAGRLILPFAGPRLPSRSYCTYVPEIREGDPLISTFRAWLEDEGANARAYVPSRSKRATRKSTNSRIRDESR